MHSDPDFSGLKGRRNAINKFNINSSKTISGIDIDGSIQIIGCACCIEIVS